ncbi:MAG: hypothetical protein RL062_712 [Bacteroidota bacterium]|jgi:hypothetical protein
MKKIVLLVVLAITTNVLLAQWITNNGFENWSNSNGYNTPDSWSSFNDYTAAAGVYTCMKGMPAPVGNAYLKLITKSLPGVGIIPGMVTNGILDPTTMQISGGTPFAEKPSHFTGKWLFMAATTADIGFIKVYLTHFDATLGVKDTVAVAQVLLPDMEMSWIDFSIPFVYNNSNTPDTCLIIASASGHTPLVNSYLYLDNLDFTIPTSMNEISDGAMQVYPNPCSDRLMINTGNQAIQSVIVYDQMGRICYAQNANSVTGKLEVSTAQMPVGQYWIRMISEQSNAVFPFQKQ